MTINEFQIQLDISSGDELKVLKQHTYETKYGYVFVDSSNGQCYLLDEHGHLDDISKVKRIGDNTFYYSASLEYCKSLKSIIIPNSVKSIGEWIFAGYKSLESIIIPDSVKSIGKHAFYNCTSLRSIIIPDSVKSIGNKAFCWCTSLNEVIFKGKTIDQVKIMDYYPWGIKDTSIIRCQMS